jgi:hypothetical protein
MSFFETFSLTNLSRLQFDVLSSAIVEFEKSINFNYKHLVYSYFSWYDGAGQLQVRFSPFQIDLSDPHSIK